MQHLVPYRYNTYTDILIAVGNAVLIEYLYNIPRHQIVLQATTVGFSINYPDDLTINERNPFIQIKDKANREISDNISLGHLWDKTLVQKGESPDWWGTVSVINTLSSPDFNNTFYNNYSSNLGKALLDGDPVPTKGSRSQLLYAQASKGVNSTRLSSTQGNIKADAEQVVAHLGYLYGAAGFIRDNYTITVIPRPSQDGPISLENYLELVSYLRTFQPRASSKKILPTSDQTLPFFLSMMYFEFVEKLFDYLPQGVSKFQYAKRRGVGRVIGSLDRMIYYKMGTSSAPFIADSLSIPLWLESKPTISNVRDVVRNTLGDSTDPNLLYLPVRTFTENEPRLLFEFYRQYISLSSKKRLLEQKTIGHIMDATNYNDLACDAMKNFARAIRSRTLTKLYNNEKKEQPDFSLLTKLKSASLDSKRLVNMLSEFISSYNLRNARLKANDKTPEGANLLYEDLQEIILLIEKYGAEFVTNTLMAQAMSKRSEESSTNN